MHTASTTLPRTPTHSDSRSAAFAGPLGIPALGLVLLGAALAYAYALPSGERSRWLAESGPVEIASIALHLAGAGILVLSGLFQGDRGFALRSAVILGLFAAREADFHNRFTTEGIFRTSYYFRSHAPTAEKAVVVAVLLLIAFVCLTLLAFYSPRVLRALRSGSAWAVAGALGLVLLVSGKSLDAMTWISRAIGTDYTPPIETVKVFEESTELVGAALLCAAALLYTLWWRGQKTRESVQS